MIDLGKRKEVTAVLKLWTQLSPKKDYFLEFLTEHIGFWALRPSKWHMSDPMYFQWAQTTSGTQCAHAINYIQRKKGLRSILNT